MARAIPARLRRGDWRASGIPIGPNKSLRSGRRAIAPPR